MRGIKRRILAVIEEVEHEIRVDLGLEEPTEVEPVETVEALEVAEESPIIEDPEEWEEVKAFEKVLDEICTRYESEETEIGEEEDIEEYLEETEDWDGIPSEVLEKILTIL